MSRWLILVPARFGSSRFPGKPLAKIHNKAMIHYIVDNCRETAMDYAIVTDNQEIEDAVKNYGGQCVRVDDDVPSGSERIALAYERFFKQKNYELVINLQGDDPLMKSEMILKIASEHAQTNHDIYTAIKKRKSTEVDFLNPNVVKAIVSKDKKCLYFTRTSSPFNREQTEYDWYQHIGVYSYKPESLLKFVALEQSPLEKLESLEQLRAIENDLTIGASYLDLRIMGVDTPEDITKLEGVLSGKKI